MMRRCWGWALIAALCSSGPVWGQGTGTITGRVTEGTTDRALPGAQVLVVGTQLGARADADGRYSIPGVPAGQRRVQATLVGYGTRVETVLVGAGQTATVSLSLQAQALALEGVVAVGYGTQRRRDVTGAISSVSVDEIPAIATITSAGQLLQGRVAGAQVVQNNGAPGAGISIRIRGTNSITANSEPLYVIDGLPAYVGSNSQDPYRNPLASINPQDIESIEVLKDASATAIYGSRGANGVVLITTKQGRRGDDEVTIESNFGRQAPARVLEMLDGRQFAEMANEARINGGQAPAYTRAQIDAVGAGTDWQSLVLRDAPMQSHSLSFSGGTEQTRYLVSGSYFGQEGIVRGSGFERYSARINLDQTVSGRLQVGTNFTVSNTDSDLQITDNALGNGTVMGALWFNPVSPVRDPDTGGYVMNSPVTWPVVNPVALVEGLLNQRNFFSLVGNVFGEYRLAEGLRLRSSVGTNTRFERTRYFAPRTTPLGIASNGEGRQFSGTSFDLINENILSYTRSLRESDNLDLTGGFTVQSSRDEGVNASNAQFANDNTGVYNLSAGTLPTADTDFSEWGLLSWLGRANYALLDRYIFTLTGRFDGSSRFGENSKWGFFPSAAVAWRLSDEPFMRDQAVFSDLKLRLGYGETGNQEIGLYQSLARLATDNYSFGRATVIGYTPAGAAPNPDLKWETTRQFNAGIDFGVLGDRVTGSLEAYHSVTDDLLLSVDLPSTSGYASQLRNVGSVRNDGVELSLNTANVETSSFRWSSIFSIATNRNEVLDLGVAKEIPGPEKGISGQTGGTTVIIRVGEPVGSFLGYQTSGLYQAGEACPLTVRRRFLDCEPGEYRYVDANADGRINAQDRVIIGNGQPDFYGGLTNDFSLGPIELNVFLQGSYGGEVLNGPAINLRNVNPLSNQSTAALDRWTPQNTDTEVPRANSVRPREIYDVHVEDGSFVRLQDVTLGYRIPHRLIPGATNARLYVSGQNLHVWTSYTGYDPEVNSFGGNAISRGIDLGAYPRARTWNVGLRATF